MKLYVAFWLDSAVRATPEKLPLSHAKPTFWGFESALSRIADHISDHRRQRLLTLGGHFDAFFKALPDKIRQVFTFHGFFRACQGACHHGAVADVIGSPA